MTTTITLILGLLVTTIIFASLATRLHIPYAILLVLGGLLLGLIPALPEIDLNPELILFLFLPPLVFSSAWQTSWRAFRSNLRSILLLAIGLVIFTTLCVAIIAHLLLGFPWPVAFVLGAILSPTDAVAASAIAQRMNLSPRIATILEGESMVNDATGLVIYTFAVAAAVSGHFALTEVAWQFIVVGVGGLVIGLLIAWPIAWLHRYIDDAPIEITITLLTPFAAYLLAEEIHVSGVLATLSAGLYLSRHSSRFFSSTTRLQANAVWNVLVFILNGLLFLLIGLQLRRLLSTVMDGSTLTILAQTACISLTVIIVRLLWVFASTYLPRWAVPALRAHDPYPGNRNVLVIGWTGLRGGISLTAALALPLALAGGQPFFLRDLLIAVTFGVILVTLVGQGLSLVPLIQWLALTGDGTPEKERQRARLIAAQAAIVRLQELVGEEWTPQDYLEKLRARYEEKAAHANGHLDGTLAPEEDTFATHQRLHREVIAAERNAVIGLRDQGEIDDEVLRVIERELDLEDERFQGDE